MAKFIENLRGFSYATRQDWRLSVFYCYLFSSDWRFSVIYGPHTLKFCLFVCFHPGFINFVTLSSPINHVNISWCCHSNGALHTHRCQYRRKLSCLRDNKEKSRYEVRIAAVVFKNTRLRQMKRQTYAN